MLGLTCYIAVKPQSLIETCTQPNQSSVNFGFVFLFPSIIMYYQVQYEQKSEVGDKRREDN